MKRCEGDRDRLTFGQSLNEQDSFLSFHSHTLSKVCYCLVLGRKLLQILPRSSSTFIFRGPFVRHIARHFSFSTLHHDEVEKSVKSKQLWKLIFTCRFFLQYLQNSTIKCLIVGCASIWSMSVGRDRFNVFHVQEKHSVCSLLHLVCCIVSRL